MRSYCNSTKMAEMEKSDKAWCWWGFGTETPAWCWWVYIQAQALWTCGHFGNAHEKWTFPKFSCRRWFGDPPGSPLQARAPTSSFVPENNCADGSCRNWKHPQCWAHPLVGGAHSQFLANWKLQNSSGGDSAVPFIPRAPWNQAAGNSSCKCSLASPMPSRPYRFLQRVCFLYVTCSTILISGSASGHVTPDTQMYSTEMYDSVQLGHKPGCSQQCQL